MNDKTYLLTSLNCYRTYAKLYTHARYTKYTVHKLR